MIAPPDTSALSHLRVLDLTRARAGPTCCRILADFGADVLKIDAPPGVDPNEGMSGARDGYDMINLHRNKRSLTLNLKENEGREIFLRLARKADVVVENFRPDVKERLGIGYEALRRPIRESFSPRSPVLGRPGRIACVPASIKLRREWAD